MKVSEGEMTFLDHLEELRWHIIRSAVAVLVVAVIAFVFKDYIFALLFAPKNGDFFTYQMFCKIGHWFNFEQSSCLLLFKVERWRVSFRLIFGHQFGQE